MVYRTLDFFSFFFFANDRRLSNPLFVHLLVVNFVLALLLTPPSVRAAAMLENSSFSSFLSIQKKNPTLQSSLCYLLFVILSHPLVVNCVLVFCFWRRCLSVRAACNAGNFLFLLLFNSKINLSKIKSTAYENVRRLHATILFLFHAYHSFFLMNHAVLFFFTPLLFCSFFPLVCLTFVLLYVFALLVLSLIICYERLEGSIIP